MSYEAIIGLEIHARLEVDKKIFCDCPARFGDSPNKNVCPTCLGLPGAMPALNLTVLQPAVRSALALGCRVQEISAFDRKNYFYPDLPKGYQITQFKLPLAVAGEVEVPGGDRHTIRIERAHLEEDAGKIIRTDEGEILIDFNRAGVPLLEIVTEPNLRTPDEAAQAAREIRRILVYLDVCDGNMQEGSFRVDANISLRKQNDKELGTKVEIKNLNSFSHLKQAMEHEIQRQSSILDFGGEIEEETRGWSEEKKRTESLRTKERLRDYRYFFEPDLPPISLSNEFVDLLRTSIPELPAQRRRRFELDFGLTSRDVFTLTENRLIAEFFEKVDKEIGDPNLVAAFILGDVLAISRLAGPQFDSPASEELVASILKMIKERTISKSTASIVFKKALDTGKKPETIVSEDGLRLVSDESVIEGACDGVLTEYPSEVSKYKNGKRGLFGFFVGRVMGATGGAADPVAVSEMLRRKLDE